MSERIDVLVVDDECHARAGMRSLLATESDVRVVGEAGNGGEALSCIRSLSPDIVFLDISMPDRTGLQLMQDLDVRDAPKVVFVTAYSEHALPAFEVCAVDYVLKPFTDDRFRTAMDKARRQVLLERRRRGGAGRPADNAGPDSTVELERFSVKTEGVLKVFSVEQIDWIEADEYCVRLHIAGRQYMVRESLGALESALPRAQFVRIHRSTIVNVARIRALEPMFRGDCIVVLSDGTKLRMSRRRRAALADRIKSFS